MAVQPFDYAGSVQDAIELIEEFGGPLILRSFTDGGDSWNPSRTPADVTVKGVIIDYSLRVIDGTRIRATDKHALISPDAAVAPTEKMQLIQDGETYEIVPPVGILKPAATVLLYDVQVRK